MPEFETYVDVDVNEFVSACSKREIKELIEVLIEDGHINPSASENTNKTIGESQFIEKIDGLKENFTPFSRR